MARSDYSELHLWQTGEWDAICLNDEEETEMADEETKDKRRHVVHVLRFHTNKGEEHQTGDSYEVPEDELDNLVAQGMVSLEAPKPPEEPTPV